MKILQPPGWPRPKGYSAGMSADGTVITISGQIGWDASGTFVAPDIAGQVRQALRNIVEIVGEAGGRPEHIVRLTWYVVDIHEYVVAQKDIGLAYRDVMGRHYPAMTVVAVAGFVELAARVEIEATAVIPRADAAQLTPISG